MRIRLEEYRSRVAIVYVLGLFIQIIDGTIVNIAIPTLADELGVEETEVDWAVIGFYVALAVMIPISGWLGDRFGTKRMFLTALGGFVLASVLCATAQTLDQLILFRFVQGAFSGLITPIGSAMLFRAFPLAERARASTTVIGVAVIAPAVGPVLGGVIIETLSWRWIFYVNVPIGAAGLILGARWLREEIVGTSGRIDWAGIVLSGSGLALVLFGLSEGSGRGWGSPVIVASLVAGSVALMMLAIVELRVENPVLALRLLGVRLFRATNLTAAPAYAAFFGFIFLMPIFLQKLAGHTALETGIILLPQPLGVIVSSQLVARRLYATVGPRGLLLAGCIGAFLASGYFVTIDATTSAVAVGTALFARGLAMGLVFVAVQTAAYAAIALPDMARATSLFNTQRQAAVAAGVALVASVLAANVSSLDDVANGGSPLSDRVDAFQLAFGVSALLFAVAALCALTVRNADAAETMATTKTVTGSTTRS